ncbi:hypothetical protein HMI54_014626 [Coelomomyces lativittatus]|nr:hypothetical protein HMI55_001808 [Coelomomyces lativittatus]KAJ1513888.1 hypothetical protein HMI54_014626 [Coelomomyces lativittatus]KAJ1514692.1 hypothetical protein HMI56_007647 [Coelomomyces lativittatus]
MTLNGLTIRVKRLKTTFFIQCSATDNIITLKKRLSKLTHKEIKDIRLLVPKDKISTQIDYSIFGNKDKWAELDDKTVLDQIGMPDDAVVYMIFWISGEVSASDGRWENIDIPMPDPLVPPDSEGIANSEEGSLEDHIPGSEKLK